MIRSKAAKLLTNVYNIDVLYKSCRPPHRYVIHNALISKQRNHVLNKPEFGSHKWSVRIRGCEDVKCTLPPGRAHSSLIYIENSPSKLKFRNTSFSVRKNPLVKHFRKSQSKFPKNFHFRENRQKVKCCPTPYSRRSKTF